VKAGLNPAGKQRRNLSLVAAALTLIIGLRREVGADWTNYLHVFEHIKMLSMKQAMLRIEPAYGLLNWIAVQLGWGIWFVNLVCAGFFVWGLVTFCRQQPTPAIALLIALPYLIIGVAMGYTRQSAALGLVLLALSQYFRGATAHMIISLVFAAAFHNSALIMVPLLALAAAQRRTDTTIIVTLLMVAVAYQFYDHILARLTAYSETAYTAGGAAPRVAMNVIPAIIFLIFRRRFTAPLEELRLWTIFAFASLLTIVLLFVLQSTTLVDRIGIYLIPLQLFVLSRLPIVFGSPSRQNMLVVFGLIAYAAAVQFVWLSYGTWGRAWIPYNNYIWDSIEGGEPGSK
jgi:hypothetical protein